MTFLYNNSNPKLQITKHLQLHEVNTGNASLIKIHPLLIVAWRILRDGIGRPLTVSSGYRTPAYNRREDIKGGKKSQHLFGKALDISAHNIDGGVSALAELCEDCIRNIRNQGNILISGHLGSFLKDFVDHDIYGGIGIYNSFVHIDVRKDKARWNG